MLRVTFGTSEDGASLILSIKGHAGQAETGKDLVCASASILAYTVAQIVKDMYNGGKLRKKPTIKLKEGDTNVVCKPKKAFRAEALHSYFVAQVGYNLLAHNFPKCVRLTMFGKDIESLAK
jgi:uncharacterized protein YsxB (DUF464 family)